MLGFRGKIYQCGNMVNILRIINVNGGFMPIFPHYGEDDNYCHRVRFSGYKIGYCPNLTAIHDRGDHKKSLSINYHLIEHMLPCLQSLLIHLITRKE